MKYLLFAFLILNSLITFAQIDTVSNLSEKDKIFGLSLFWKEASYNFAYFEKSKINWDSTYQAFIPEILATRNSYEYYRQLKRFAALLKDGHTDIDAPSFGPTGNFNAPIWFDYLEDKFIVTGILKADTLKVPLGSELIAVNGFPLNTFLNEQLFPYISSSTDKWLRIVAATQLLPYDTVLSTTFKLKTIKGDTVTYASKLTKRPIKTTSRIWENRYSNFFYSFPNGIAYINLFSFRDNNVIDSFKKYLPELYKAKGIIINMRFNGGGDSRIGEEILKYFTTQMKIKQTCWKTLNHLAYNNALGHDFRPEDTSSFSFQDRKMLKIGFKVAKKDYWYTKNHQYFDNDPNIRKIKSPMVVLIGNSTASAAEDFLAELCGLKGRATLIGESTEGSTGEPLTFDLPGGGRARICTIQESYPDGKPFVGLGIPPDIEVKRTIKDFLEDKDATLDKALEVLLSKMAKATR